MSFETLLRERSANEYAAFLIEHLHADDDVLDCGCGEATITIGLAQHVHKGSVMGIDLDEKEFDAARAFVLENRLTNLTFCAADMTRLPFEQESFSAAFCHSSIEAVRDPVAALGEIRRVLRPGGVIGVACVEYEGVVIAGADENLLKRFYAVRETLWRRESWANPRLGKQLRGLLHRAGYERVTLELAYISQGTAERIFKFGMDRANECREPSFIELVTQHTLATLAELGVMAAAWEQWASAPDSFFGFTWARAIARKPTFEHEQF